MMQLAWTAISHRPCAEIDPVRVAGSNAWRYRPALGNMLTGGRPDVLTGLVLGQPAPVCIISLFGLEKMSDGNALAAP
jgi:hypothetical protein